MKRKYGDRADWKRVVEREYAQTYLESDDFIGHLTLIKISKVAEPLYAYYDGKRICIADDEYLWLQQFPADKHHSVTTMFNADGKVVQWYIDICHMTGVDVDGRPWMDDLFLDLIVLPTGEVVRKDVNELEEALTDGVIDKRLYTLALEESARLIEQIREGEFNLLKLSVGHKDLLLNRLTSL